MKAYCVMKKKKKRKRRIWASDLFVFKIYHNDKLGGYVRNKGGGYQSWEEIKKSWFVVCSNCDDFQP